LDQGIDLTELAQLRRAVDHELLDEHPSVDHHTPLHVVVAGAAAGVGATSVATHLAAALNRQHMRTLAWSSDHPFEHFTERGFQSPAAADVLLFDVGCNAAQKFDRLWEIANLALFVVTPESKSILDGYAAIKQLAERHPHLKIRAIVNFARDAVEADRIHTQLASTCRQFLNLEIIAAGFVPRITNLSASINAQPTAVRKPSGEGGSVIEKQFEQIASRVAIDFPINYLRSVSKKNLKFAESAVTAGRY
jgi:hypothetical protein